MENLIDKCKLRALCENDTVVGKPIEAFYDIPDIEHNDEARAEYAKAYWGTVAELAREGH